jgi:hypothetical protein
MYSSLGEVSVLSQILNIKLSSFTVLERKEKKEDTLLCNGVNRGLLTSVLTLHVFYVCMSLWWLWFVIHLGLYPPPSIFYIMEVYRTPSS